MNSSGKKMARMHRVANKKRKAKLKAGHAHAGKTPLKSTPSSK